MPDINSTLQTEGFFTTKLEEIINWSRKNSVWPMPMGISCCAIEMMALATRVSILHDLARKLCVFLQDSATL